jgi:hypothetical protein
METLYPAECLSPKPKECMIPDFITCSTEVFSLRLTSSLPESVKLNFTKTKLPENKVYVKSQIESHIENIPFSLLFPSKYTFLFDRKGQIRI